MMLPCWVIILMIIIFPIVMVMMTMLMLMSLMRSAVKYLMACNGAVKLNVITMMMKPIGTKKNNTHKSQSW
jgi:hypothetical protein